MGGPLLATKMVGAESSSKEDAIDGAALKGWTDVRVTSEVSYRSDGSIGS